MVDTIEVLDGAASLIKQLEEKAEGSEGVTMAELMAVRCVIETCTKKLDAIKDEF